MAKGGRYLDKNKSTKKKGKGKKALLIVLIILVLIIVGVIFAAKGFIGSMLGNVTRAEYEEKNQDKSYEDLVGEIYNDMDMSGYAVTETESVEDLYVPEAQEDDVYVPEDIQAPVETTAVATQAAVETTSAE